MILFVSRSKNSPDLFVLSLAAHVRRVDIGQVEPLMPYHQGPRSELFISRWTGIVCAGTPGPSSSPSLVNHRLASSTPPRLQTRSDSLRNSQFMPACTRLTANLQLTAVDPFPFEL